MNDFYKILGVDRDAPKSVIDAVFRALSKHHQNANPHFPMEKSKELIQLEQAHAVLSDPQQRKKYDELLAIKERIESQSSADILAAPTPQENTKPTPAPLLQQEELDDTSNKPDVIKPTSKEEQKNELQQAYTALIGDKSTDYYLYEFARFDQQQKRGGVSWFGSMNWFSGLFTILWMFYRKMYALGFVLLIVLSFIGAVIKLLGTEIFGSNIQVAQLVYGIALVAVFGKIGNRLYYNHCHKHITISKRIRNKKGQFAYLTKNGSVSNNYIYYALIALFVVFIIGTIAAVSLPSMADKNKPKSAVVQPTNPNAQSWDDYVADFEDPWEKHKQRVLREQAEKQQSQTQAQRRKNKGRQELYNGMVQKAQRINTTLPKTEGSTLVSLTFTKIIVGKDLSVNKFYTVNRMNREDAQYALNENRLRAIKSYCTDAGTKEDLNVGISFKDIYSMPSGEEIYRIHINQHSCR